MTESNGLIVFRSEMRDKVEVLVSSDGSGLTVYDDQTGNQLHHYKTGQTAGGTVTWLGQDWLMSAGRDKPLLNVWQVNKSEQSSVRLFSPATVSAMAASPSGLYLVVATQENLNIYLVSTGELLGVVSRHYQPVTVLAWTDDSSHCVSGGEDGQVLVWSLVAAVSRRHLPGLQQSKLGQVEPRYSWTDHALPVTALRVGRGAANMARLVTASRDMTVKVYSLTRGLLLLSVSLTSPVTSLAMDNMETVVWAGLQSGEVARLSLLSPPRDVTVSSETLEATSLTGGHSTSITQLALSCDGLSLASGDTEGNIHIWDSVSAQIVRTIKHRTAITHLEFVLTPPSLVNKESWCPTIKVVPLQKGLRQQGDKFQCILQRKNDLEVPDDGKVVGMEAECEVDDEDVSRSDHTVEELKQINNKLYKYALKNVIDSR